MASIIDLWSHNIGFDLRRRASKKQPDRQSTPAIRPTLDTSTGIIAIRYSGSDDSSVPSTPQSEASDKSFVESPVDEPIDRPALPKRSASRRIIHPLEYDRPVTPAATSDKPPPIPPKSPYRASRAMIRLQRELAEMPEDEEQPDDAAAEVDSKA